jgi:hypothetical protein
MLNVCTEELEIQNLIVHIAIWLKMMSICFFTVTLQGMFGLLLL